MHKVKDSHDSLCRYECTSLWQSWKPFEQSVRCELNVASQQITQLQADLVAANEKLTAIEAIADDPRGIRSQGTRLNDIYLILHPTPEQPK